MSAVLAALLLFAPVLADAAKTDSYPEPAKEVYEQALRLAKEGKTVNAAGLFKEAAERGNRRAQYQLGLLYARGDGVTQDFKKAKMWLHKAAMQGHPKAQYFLGEMYARGDGVDEDFVEATVWFWLATSLGDPYAKKRLRAISIRISQQEMVEAKVKANTLWKQIPHDMKIKASMAMH
jgi:TPR repeat protein